MNQYSIWTSKYPTYHQHHQKARPCDASTVLEPLVYTEFEVTLRMEFRTQIEIAFWAPYPLPSGSSSALVHSGGLSPS